jgi:hypothetical protein
MRFEYTAFHTYIPNLKQTGAHAGTILSDSYYLHFVMVHLILTRIDACYRQGTPLEPVIMDGGYWASYSRGQAIIHGPLLLQIF